MVQRSEKVLLLQQAKGSNPLALPALFIGEGVSQNKTNFPREVLQRSASMFNGSPIYVDHPTLTESIERRGGRSIRDLVGIIQNAEAGIFKDKQGLDVYGIGGTVLLSKNASWILDMMSDGVYGGDLSMVAFLSGDYDADGIVFNVSAILQVLSVDFVDAAAAKGFLQAAQSIERVNLDELDTESILFMDMQEEQALVRQGDLVLTMQSTDRPPVNLTDDSAPTDLPNPNEGDQTDEVEEPADSTTSSESTPETPATDETPVPSPATQTMVTLSQTELEAMLSNVVETALRKAGVTLNPDQQSTNRKPPAGSTLDLESISSAFFSASNLAPATIARIKKRLDQEGFNRAAMLSVNRSGKPEEAGNLYRGVLQQLLEEETQYLESVAPALISGLGSSPAGEEDNLENDGPTMDDILAEYNMLNKTKKS